jgi:predicted DNA-binding protein
MRRITIRITDELNKSLEMFATVDGTPMVDVVRAAIEKYLAEQRRRPDYQAKLKARLKAENVKSYI